MLKKEIICILLVIILIFGTSIISIATNNDNIQNEENKNIERNNNVNIDINDLNELNQQRNEIQNKLQEVNNQLEYVQGEISNSVVEIQKLSDKIAQYEEENRNLNLKLEGLENSIFETSTVLEKVTDEYIKKDKQLKDRLVAIYEAGEISYLDVLLSSNSLSEFLSRYYKMQEIAEYDSKLIDEVAQKKKTIEISKKKLENETTEVKIIKARSEQTETVLKNAKTLQEEYINLLSEQEKQINDEINTYKIECAIIESKIQAISIDISQIDIQYTGGSMIWPVAKKGTSISSYFGDRLHPIYGVIKFHQGIDIANVGFGAPVVSVLDGEVTYAGELGSYGNCVMIYHGNGITTLYGHGQQILTQYGAKVKQGDIIMQTGSTGNSTGPHLHFEVRTNGIPIDPLPFVKAL